MRSEEEIIGDIRKFESTIADRADEKQRIKYGSLLQRAIGGTLRTRRLKAINKQRLSHIRPGRRYGYLRTSKDKGRRTRDGMRYRATCDCGETLELSTTDLHQRDAMSVGCMGEDCPYGSLEAKVWFNPKFALWVQLSFLLSNRPEEVDNSWGGQAYEGVEKVTPDTGEKTFFSDVWPHVKETLHEKAWWMHRINPVLPYSSLNVRFNRSPDPEIIQVNLDTIRYGHHLYRIGEIASLLDLPTERVTELRSEIYSDNALMDRLIEEAGA